MDFHPCYAMSWNRELFGDEKSPGSWWETLEQGGTSAMKKKTGWLGYIRDDQLPNLYGDFFINHYKDPYEPTRIQWNVNRVWVLNVAHLEDGSPKNWIRRPWMGPPKKQAIKFGHGWIRGPTTPRNRGLKRDTMITNNLLTGMILQVGGEHEFMT